MLQSTFDKLFKHFTFVNIGLIIADSHYQDQQLKHLRGGYPLLVEHFDELVQQIRGGHTILAASDGSYLEDRRIEIARLEK